MAKKQSENTVLTFWNTLHHKLKPFSTRTKEVGLYTCGPTVYSSATIGNFRAYVFDDILRRTLIFFGYQVKHVMNITDVGHLVSDADEGEDKIERAAKKEGKSAWDIARAYEERFLLDAERLNLLRPTIMPRATEHIQEQIDLIKILEKKGFTYQISDGIYFDTSKFISYGALSGQKLDEKKEGARVEVNAEKKHPTDFALWKFSLENGKRQMEWESPWGVGFPGWHIECSAMSRKYLGQPFDIHCGGVDHIAVHHENEIAQSEAAFDEPLARFWMHNEYLLVDGKRMGKSEGNAYTLADLEEKGFDPLAFRYYCLGTHYRQKMNFTWEGLEAAQQALKKLQMLVRQLPTHNIQPITQNSLNLFNKAIANDLNTPQALATMWDLIKGDEGEEEKAMMLLKMDDVFGLRLGELIGQQVEIPLEVQELAQARVEARKKKNWKKADELRRKIESMGWSVKDRENGGYEMIAH